MPEQVPRFDSHRTLAASDLPPIVLTAIEACLERNAREGVVLDLRGLSDAADFFLIAAGDSDVHVKAITEQVLQELAKEGVRPSGIEGQATGRWVLIDYFDLVVHIFHPVLREFYQLERLWGDAPRLALEEVSP